MEQAWCNDCLHCAQAHIAKFAMMSHVVMIACFFLLQCYFNVYIN